MAATIRIGTASWTDHDPFYPPEYNNARTKAYFSPDEFASGHDHMADLPPVLWPPVPQSEALLTALMFQSMLGQPIGQGEPLPEAVDQTFLTAALHLPSDSPTVS